MKRLLVAVKLQAGATLIKKIRISAAELLPRHNQNPRMRKEDLLIRRLLSLNSNREQKEEINIEISPGINWAYFLEKSKEERVATILYKLFMQTEKIKGLIPEGIFEHLKNIYFWTQRENMLCLKSIKEILSVFEGSNINVITFKGPVLAELIYNDLGLRPMRDWDILIRPQNFREADYLFEKKFSYFKRFRPNQSYAVSINPYRNSILYNNINSYPKHIHLYWHLINLLPYNNAILTKFNMEKIWRDSTIENLGEIKMRTLSPEHHLIYLCLHALNHGYNPLLLLCDISEMIKKNKDKIDWDILTGEAFDFGLSKPVYYGLYSACKVLGADIPPKAITRLKPKKQSIFEIKFFSSLIKGKTAINDPNTAFFLNFVFNQTLNEKVNFTLAALFPPRKDLLLIRQSEQNNSALFVHTKRIKAGLTSAGKCLYSLIFN